MLSIALSFRTGTVDYARSVAFRALADLLSRFFGEETTRQLLLHHLGSSNCEPSRFSRSSGSLRIAQEMGSAAPAPSGSATYASGATALNVSGVISNIKDDLSRLRPGSLEEPGMNNGPLSTPVPGTSFICLLCSSSCRPFFSLSITATAMLSS